MLNNAVSNVNAVRYCCWFYFWTYGVSLTIFNYFQYILLCMGKKNTISINFPLKWNNVVTRSFVK